MNSWMSLAAQIVALAFGGAGVYRIIEALSRRRTIKADATETLASSVTDWAEDLKVEAREARDRADKINAELDLARDKVHEVTDKVHELNFELNMAFATIRRWKAAILDDTITRQMLVAMVNTDYPNNKGA